MQFLQQYYYNILKYDLINKFNYTNLKEIPKLKEIILNFGCKSFELKILITSLLALQLITKKKGKLTTSKKSNILLKIRKGNPVGCKIILKKEFMYKFFTKFILKILPRLKTEISTKKLKNIKVLTYHIKNILIFKELEKNYNIFNNIQSLNITILTNVKTKKELFFLLNSFKIKINCKRNSIGRV